MIDEQTWAELATPAAPPGLVRRRVREDSSRDIFIAVHHPGGERVVVLSVASNAVANLGDPPRTRAVTTTVHHGSGTAEIRISLLIPEMGRVFTSFVDDLVSAVGDVDTDEEVVTTFRTRFSLWRRLLGEVPPEGLGSAAARGLFGELWVLRHIALEALGDHTADAWRGPAKEDRDLLHGDVAVEVKTTISDQPVAVAINDERQLDGEGFTDLFLVALALDERVGGGGGQTLNEMIEDLRDQFAADDARAAFREKLTAYGWSEVHRDRYARTAYVVREVTSYRTAEGFPRLVESDLPTGVGKVRYRLALSACEPWKVPEDVVADALRTASAMGG